MSETLSSRLRRSFRHFAPRTAVHIGERTLTYEELGARAEGVAQALAAHGIGCGQRVGLWIEKSADGLAAMLGTLLVGATYVPIDVRAPVRRSLTVAANADLSALVVDELRRPQLADARAALPGLRLVLEADGTALGGDLEPRRGLARLPISALRGGASFSPPGEEPRAEDSAYILYTSGSTGRPKGVVISHRAALGFVDWCLQVLKPRPEDRMVSHAPWHFDLSTFDLFVTFCCGASVRLLTSAEAMLAGWIARNLGRWGISVWYSVPSALIAMLEQQPLDVRSWPQARLVLFAGEPFPTPRLVELRRALPQARLFNLFGPTETNVCTYYEVDQLAEGETRPIPIGRVCEHLEALILDDDGAEVTPGSEGDLWIAGPNLLTAYWRDPELTALKLRPDPRPGRGGQLFYNTGDRVRLGEDGNLIFLGRRDHLVKVRGHRVELGEVESALYSFAGLAEAAVVALLRPAGHRLVAFVSWKEGVPQEQERLLAHLRERVPLYMIPEQWHRVERLPRTSNGKVDRVGLVQDAERLEGTTTTGG